MLKIHLLVDWTASDFSLLDIISTYASRCHQIIGFTICDIYIFSVHHSKHHLFFLIAGGRN